MGADEPETFCIRIAIITTRDLPHVVYNALTAEISFENHTVSTKPVANGVTPNWNEQFDFFFSEKSHAPSLKVSLFEQERFKKRPYGVVDIPIVDLFSETPVGTACTFNDPENGAAWYRLSPENVKTKVSGEILMHIGFVASPPPPPHEEHVAQAIAPPAYVYRVRADWIVLWRRLAARLSRPRKTVLVHMQHLGKQFHMAAQDISTDASKIFK
jgi:hypothetical protein